MLFVGSKKMRTLGKKLALAGLSLGVCLLCVDVALQVRRVRRDAAKDTWPDPVLHHKWAPSRTTVDRARSIPCPLTISAQSWVEDYDVAKTKPEGVYRVFYVGDSTTQGVVAPEHKMVELVDRELNRRAKGKDSSIEVINTGTSSYSFLLYYLLIKTRLLDYDPDLVVINIDMTDAVNDYVYRQTAVTDESGDVIAVRPPQEDFSFQYYTTPEGIVQRRALPPFRRWLSKWSGLAYYAERYRERERWRAIEAGMPLDETANWMRSPWSDAVSGSVDRSLSVLTETIDLLRDNGVAVLVTSVPNFGQFTGVQSAEPHRCLEKWAENEGVPFLNGFTALRPLIDGSAQPQYYWSSDPSHFNITGNAIWAEAQLVCLLPLLPSLNP